MKLASKVLLTSLFCLAVAGCSGGSGSEGSAAGKGPVATGKSLTVGIVFDSGGLGDKSFNDGANRGIEKAKADFGIDTKPVESKSNGDYEANIETLAEQKCDLVIAVGGDMKDAVQSVAPKFPDVKFVTIDASLKGDNVRSLLFTEEQGSFLAGYLAGLVTKTNKIGFVGGEEIPLIKKFEVGYEAGAKTSNPRVEVLPAKYTGNWDDVDAGKQAATILFQSGADIVYHAAGRAGLGVIGAAKDQNKFAIGVDSDQDDVAPGHVLTSVMKHVDNAVYQTIQDLKDGKFTTGDKVYDLKAGGVGLSPMTYTKAMVGPATLKKLDAVKDQITSGKIVVPTDEQGLKSYVASVNAP